MSYFKLLTYQQLAIRGQTGSLWDAANIRLFQKKK